MSDIFICIRNQDGYAMTSVEGDELLQITFTYLEPERQLLNIFVQHYPFDMSGV